MKSEIQMRRLVTEVMIASKKNKIIIKKGEGGPFVLKIMTMVI